MKNLLALFFITFLYCNILSSQVSDSPEFSKFTIHTEINSLVLYHSFTINLEGHIANRKWENVNLYIMAGFNYSNFSGSENNEKSSKGGQVALTILTGKGEHHMEANVGIHTVTSSSGYFQLTVPFPLFNVGYRYQAPKGGMIFRAKIGTQGVGIGVGVAF